MLKNLFGRKIAVKFIDAETGSVFAQSEMNPDQLPETFEINTTLHIGENEWSVEDATPPTAKEFIESKQLILKLRKIEYLNPQELKFTLPTVSNELPQITEKALFNDFEETLHEDDWRQNEFPNSSALPVIKSEIQKIRDVWETQSEKVNDEFYCFENVHVRENVGIPNLLVDFSQLKAALKVAQTGRLKIDRQGFVENGFSLKTDFTTYYGILNNDTVTQLGVSAFSENSAQEFVKINRLFGLVFVSWCSCEIIAGS